MILQLVSLSDRQSDMDGDTEYVAKAVRIPRELWERIEEAMKGGETDFSKFCRTALRMYLDSLNV